MTLSNCQKTGKNDEEFKIFLEAVTVIAAHTNPEVAGKPCETCRQAKMLIILIGGSEVKQ